jgi:MFS family permease
MTATTFRSVLAEREYRAVWAAQLVSIAGDQFARIAVSVLVYQRTRSPLLAAAAFAATVLASFAGGLLLGWVADRYPKRAVMVTSDVACTGIVLIMAIPGVPLWALLALLGVVSLAFQPFLAARMATNREILGKDRFQAGVAITTSTYQVGQLIGYSLGGVITAVAGVHVALLIDAASFATSAVLIRAWVRPRPPEEPAARLERPGLWDGVRQVFSSPVARTALALMCMAAFFVVPEGVSVPLAHQLGGGAATAGLLLAAMTAGAAAGLLGWTRLVPPGTLSQFAALLALTACAMLVPFAFSPPLGPALALLAASGIYAGYIPSVASSLFGAVPAEHRGKVSGVVGAGMDLGQGVMILVAGAVAQRLSASVTIAIIGAAGTVVAVPLALAWRRVSSLAH